MHFLMVYHNGAKKEKEKQQPKQVYKQQGEKMYK